MFMMTMMMINGLKCTRYKDSHIIARITTTNRLTNSESIYE